MPGSGGGGWPPLRSGVGLVVCGDDAVCVEKACRSGLVAVAGPGVLWASGGSLPRGCVVLVLPDCGRGGGIGGGGGEEG